MGKIKISDLEKEIYSTLLKHGINEVHAKMVTDVYMRSTFRNVGHHDISDLFSRINALEKNKINSTPNITKTNGFGALQCYDGDNGLGELCSYFITKQSMELADKYGIGFCSIRNSNHFLSAAPYVDMADEKGFFTIVLSKSPSGISLPEANVNIIGNNPFGYAASSEEGKILFDICLAYSSVGNMHQKANNNEDVPKYWGKDSQGNFTKEPKKILESGLYMPIGEHKGFGLAILVEILTAIIANGAILNQNEEQTGFKGKYSQTAISIDVKKIMDPQDYKQRNQEMINILKKLYPNIYIPGQRTNSCKEKIIDQGYFEIDDMLLDKLKE